MITLDQNIRPKAINLTGNPVRVKLTGNQMYLSLGAKHILQLAFSTGAQVTANSWIQFAFGNYSIKITFTTTPDDSGLQFKTSQAIDSAWITDFFSFLGANYYIDKFFAIVTALNTITLVAREIGIDSRIVFSKLPALTSITGFTVVNGADPVLQNGYQLVCMLYDGNDALIGEDAVTANSDQSAVIDVQEYLESEITKQRESAWTLFTYPSGEDSVIQHDEFLLEFYLRFAEKYNNQVRKLYTSTTYLALLGGLNTAKLEELAAAGKCFSDYFTEKKMFLTFSPSIKITGLRTPERLYFFNQSGVAGIVMAKKYYANNDDDEVTIGVVEDAVSVFEIICSANTFTTGEHALVKYKIWIEDGDGNALSEEKWYYVDQIFYPYEYYFLFRNSLGGYDTLRITGRMKYKPEFDRTSFENDDDETNALQVLMEQVYECNTGSITPDMTAWMNDFLLSKEVYWLYQNVSYPIFITSKKKTPVNDTDRRFNVEFEFSLSAKEKFYGIPELGNGININTPNTGSIGNSR